MGFVDGILDAVEVFVNSLFEALNGLFEALGISVTLEPLDL